MRMLLVLFLLLTACNVSDSTAQEVLEDEGYHNIHLTGHAWLGCSEEDSFSSTFTASRWVLDEEGNRTERQVEGVICCGVMKNCTVRH